MRDDDDRRLRHDEVNTRPRPRGARHQLVAPTALIVMAAFHGPRLSPLVDGQAWGGVKPVNTPAWE
jgi:hypothetical protein